MNSEAAEQQEDVEHFISEVTSQLPASSERLSTFVKAVRRQSM